MPDLSKRFLDNRSGTEILSEKISAKSVQLSGMQAERTPDDEKRTQTSQEKMRQMRKRYDLDIFGGFAIYSLLPRVLLGISWIAPSGHIISCFAQAKLLV